MISPLQRVAAAMARLDATSDRPARGEAPRLVEAPRRAEAPASEDVRIAEAILFASPEPVAAADLAARLPRDADVAAVLAILQRDYRGRGVELVQVAGRWAFRTAGDLAYALAGRGPEPQRLSRAALEMLAIIAYHQPATRAEIEEIRGVTTSKGTLDILLETGWVRLRGRRRAPGRPVTYGTTPAFLAQFGLSDIADLPGLDELKGIGLMGAPPGAAGLPIPADDSTLAEDEEPPDEADLSF